MQMILCHVQSCIQWVYTSLIKATIDGLDVSSDICSLDVTLSAVDFNFTTTNESLVKYKSNVEIN